jgi:hypothetical protein
MPSITPDLALPESLSDFATLDFEACGVGHFRDDPAPFQTLGSSLRLRPDIQKSVARARS